MESVAIEHTPPDDSRAHISFEEVSEVSITVRELSCARLLHKATSSLHKRDLTSPQGEKNHAPLMSQKGRKNPDDSGEYGNRRATKCDARHTLPGIMRGASHLTAGCRKQSPPRFDDKGKVIERWRRKVTGLTSRPTSGTP